MFLHVKRDTQLVSLTVEFLHFFVLNVFACDSFREICAAQAHNQTEKLNYKVNYDFIHVLCSFKCTRSGRARSLYKGNKYFALERSRCVFFSLKRFQKQCTKFLFASPHRKGIIK